MKKLCVGVLLASALLFATPASAGPCWGVCQAYYPCSWSCEHCYPGLGGPGYWTVDGYCMGDEVSGTCGDINQCSGQPTSNWGSEPVADQGVDLEAVLGLCH